MTADRLQILALAKQGLTAEEIGGALGYNAADIEMVLGADNEIARSVAVDKIVNKVSAGLATMQDAALAVIGSLMVDETVKPSVRLRAAEYVADEGLGLKQPKVVSNTFNIVNFNERMQEMRRRRAELESTVSVESTTKMVAA